MFEVSVFEVVDGVSEEPAGPVDDVDGGGDGGCWLGEVADVPEAGPGDPAQAGAVDEGEAGLDEAALLGQEPLHRAPGLGVHACTRRHQHHHHQHPPPPHAAHSQTGGQPRGHLQKESK